MLCRDVMTRNVVTVGPDTPVNEIAQILINRHISAVPVVDDGGQIVGIVSEGDLMRRPESGTERQESWWLWLVWEPEKQDLDFLKSHGRLAKQVMTSPVITVKEETPLSDAACVLEERRIKRVPVVRDGKLVGIVSRANLLQGLASAAFPPELTRSDAELREAVLQAFVDEGIEDELLNVTVTNGVAHLWGLADTEVQRGAAEVAAKDIKGVARVENHIAVRSADLRTAFGS